MLTRIVTASCRLAIALLMVLPLVSHATTRLVLTLEQLVSNSPQIFIGTVDEVVVTEDAGVVYSTVHFTVDDIIKGDSTLTAVELRFLGGQTATAHTEVSGQFIPEPGASGLWFVDDTSRQLVNPLTGWSQGFIPVIEKADGSRWLDLRDHPDYGILAPADPLADKMRAFNFPDQQIDAQDPQQFEFPLDDFVDVIRAQDAGLN